VGRGGGDEEEDDGEGYREEEQQMQADAPHCGLRPGAGRRSHGGEADETKDTQTEREGERRDSFFFLPLICYRGEFIFPSISLNFLL
jgi:hypothetical protein